MDSQHASSGEHPKIIGPPTPEHKLQTILEAAGKTVAAIEYGEVESRRGCTLRRPWFPLYRRHSPLHRDWLQRQGPLHDPRPYTAGRSYGPEAFLVTPCASTRLTHLHYRREDSLGRTRRLRRRMRVSARPKGL